MIIDFSFSIEDWLDLFKQLIDIFVNFFNKLGFKLFADEEATTAPEEETTA